ncbi:hypothetical protein F6U93_07865 [Tamlana haliotis]|uniref:Uncharacterized protein n=1 Tax=Pseudotamlana haliotis TaxID=2614804 RepID=A0A6N6MGH3_9FLAO|nr:hypothetical protein [Tamlana haliotis]KAB1068044.1 hypothetical protein F6U93_07865 [Tamlana haliotis]
MEKYNYLDMLLTGLLENRTDLNAYFIRSQKIADRDFFITESSFYLNVNKLISSLKKKIEYRLFERKNELYLIIDIKKSTNVNIKTTEDEINSLHKNQFPLNLLMLTDNKYTGSLYYSDLNLLDETIKSILTPNKEKKTKPKWFPIGLGFANGKIQKKIKTNSAREIAKSYNLDACHNYISLTISNHSKDPKNIYSDIDKLNLIYNHCIENNVVMCDEFKNIYNDKVNENSLK